MVRGTCGVDAEAELNLPPGFRFYPTDEELVVHYLCRKAAHQRLPVPIIAEVDLYHYDPWQLPEKALFGQREWYFFTPRNRKYPKGSRPNRAAGGGYWKATGADKPISLAGRGPRPLGIKKSLVFYAGRSPTGVKTNWIMHEYRLAGSNHAANKKPSGSLRAYHVANRSTQKKKKKLQRRRRRRRRGRRRRRRRREMAAEMVFLDVETTVPHRAGQRFWMLEFGAILVCPRKLVEVGSYCTLIRPGDLSAVPETSGRDAGITRRAVAAAPAFEEVADRIYDFLNGRVWAGHNIRRFDCARIREAFADAGRPAPEPIGIIDSLSVLTHQFGRRAGNLKMATLASYFGLGQQKHRSLDDVRMNLEVLKHCATVLLLESSLPQVLLSGNNNNNNNNNNNGLHGHSSILTRSKAMNATSCAQEEEAAASGRKSPPTYLPSHRPVPYGKKDKLGKVIKGATGVLCAAARGRQSLGANLLKHSRCLLR